MARRGRPTVSIVLIDEECDTLLRWARWHSSFQTWAQRYRIVSGCAEGRIDTEIAAELGCHPVTVSKWRHRFAEARVEGLVDAPRPGAKRTITDEMVEAVVVDTLETVPPDATHWSTRDLAKMYGISKTAVAEIWLAFGLEPWRQDSFKISPNPDLIEKTRDTVGLYLNPPDAAAVFAVDEKPEIQALDPTAPTLPMLPTTPRRATHDYVRNSTVDLFAAFDVAKGTVVTDLRPADTSKDFIRFLNKINREVPDGLDVHLALDNRSTHKTPTVCRRLIRHHGSTSISPPPTVRGSTWSNAPSRRSPPRGCNAQPTETSKNSPPTSPPGPKPGTTTPRRSCGTRQPIRSSNRSPATAARSAKQHQPSIMQRPNRTGH